MDAPLTPDSVPPTTFTYMPDATQMQAYRGPQSINGYTPDVGATQRNAAQQGQAGDGNGRKKAAGLGGLFWLLVVF